MTIAVLGSGNGGLAVAFECAAAGHTVRLFDFPQFGAAVSAVAAQGGIHAEGDLEGFAPIASAGYDLEAALRDAELVFIVGPAYSTQPFGEACRPFLKAGQSVIVCPGSCGGAIIFQRAIAGERGSGGVLVSETSTLPYAVRSTAPGRIRVFLRLRGGVFLATLPSSETRRVLAQVQPVYPMITAARNVLQTALQNGNPVIHPAVTLLNAALIERTGGDFLFYEQGVTPAVGRLMEGVDRERIALGAALGLEILSDPMLGVQQGYMTQADYHVGYTGAPGFAGIRAQGTLDHRYFHEDVGYGLVFASSLARAAAIPVPVTDALIEIISVVMQRDYRRESARSIEALGFAGLGIEDIQRMV